MGRHGDPKGVCTSDEAGNRLHERLLPSPLSTVAPAGPPVSPTPRAPAPCVTGRDVIYRYPATDCPLLIDQPKMRSVTHMETNVEFAGELIARLHIYEDPDFLTEDTDRLLWG